MHHNRLASITLGCFLLAGCCGRGADGKVEVSTLSVVEAEIGKKAVITCNFSAPENFTYVNWFYMDKNDRKKIISMFRSTRHIDETDLKGRVNLTEERSLAIEGVLLQDAKTYVCQVGAGGAGVGENRSELHVFKAPGAPELDTDRRLTASADIQEIAACVSRNGYPEPTIVWYKNDGRLEHDEHAGVNIRSIITKESSGLMTVRSILSGQVTKEDRNALYRCQVNYNLMGINKSIESESFRIEVHYPSENITLEIRSPRGEVKEGDNVTLFCEADGNPPPLYTYFRTGGHEVDSPSDLNGELFLENVQKENSDVYQCQAFDSQSPDILKAEVNLYVNYIDEPNITREQSRHPLHRGDNLTLICRAEGSKHLQFQWQKKGKVVEQGHRLTFTNLVPRDSDTYICLVTMPEIPGLSRSKRVSVAVHSEPEILHAKDVVYVQDDELLNLTCSVFSVPQLSIKWSTPGKKVSHSPTNHYHRSSTLSVSVTPELLEVGINCTATNKMGTTVHHFRLETRSEELVTTGFPSSTAKRTPESKGVIIVAVVICILLIAVLGAVLYFLHKKGKLPCGRSGKQEITKPDAHKDKIVVEVKSDKLPEEAELLQDANGEKRSAGDQGERYIDLRN